MVISIAMQSCVFMKETLDKMSTQTTQNTINFLNTMSKEELKTIGIIDRITMITWAIKFIGKHHHVEIVQAKENQMSQQVKSFKGLFPYLFKKGLPYFGMKKVN